MPTISESITQIYTGYFNRAPDPAGLNYWVGHANGGMSLTAIASSFSVQPEATTLYSFLANPAAGAPATFLNSVYLNLFNRPIDAAGSAYWTAQLANPAISVGRVIIDIISGAFGPQGSPDDAALINNKTVVGQYFVSELQRLNLDFGLDAAKNAYGGVTKDTASLTAALTALNNTLNATITNMLGSTFNLTSGTDILTGTSGNDVFNAIVDSDVGSGQTLTAGDTVNGGGGRDVLNILFNTASTVAFPNANISNVEVINLHNISGRALTFDSALVGGDMVVNLDRSSGETTITNLPMWASVGIIGDGVTKFGTVNIGYAELGGTGTVNLSGGTHRFFTEPISFTSAPISVIVNSTIAANEIAQLNVGTAAQSLTINAEAPLQIVYGIYGPSLKTITITGGAANPDAATPAVYIANSLYATIDASAMTAGGIAVFLGPLVAPLRSLKGGQGPDILAGSIGADIIDGGGGDDLLSGYEGNDVISGGAGNDFIAGGDGQDILTGGLGGDVFYFSTTAGAATGLTTGDIITDFVFGTDGITIEDPFLINIDSPQQAGVQAAVSALAPGSTAMQIATAMATANTTDHGVSYAVFGGDTYVYYEATGVGVGVAANDVFIKLLGVTI